MKIKEKLERLESLHKMILDERTGTPSNVARRLGISRGTLYKLIEELKSYNASVRYSRSKQSFIYDDDIFLEIQYSVKVISYKEDLKKINAGTSLFSFRSFFYTEEY